MAHAVAAIVAQGVCAMVMTLTPFPQLVIYIGFTLNFFAVMSVASLLIFRRRAAGRSCAWSASPIRCFPWCSFWWARG